MTRTVSAILRDIDNVEKSKHLDDATKQKIVAQYKAELKALSDTLPEHKPEKPAK